MEVLLDKESQALGACEALERHMHLYPMTNWWVNKSGEQSITHVYSLPEPTFDGVFRVLSDQKCRATVVSTKHMEGIYCEVGDYSFYIFAPSEKRSSLDFYHFNQSVDALLSSEIETWGRDNGFSKLENVNFETFKALLVTHFFAIAHKNGVDVEAVKSIKAANSFSLLLNNHRLMDDNAWVYDASHIGCFNIIYHIEILVLQEIFGAECSISIHDVATNTAHFPMLLSALHDENRLELNIHSLSCSDIDTTIPKDSISNIEIHEQHEFPNVIVEELDITVTRNSLPLADVITANDILEHFDERQGFEVLNNLWRSSGKALIVHVPFEDIPCSKYGHLNAFDKKTLRSWADKLDDCMDVTDKYSELVKSRYNGSYSEVYDQFLFLIRV